MMEHVIVVHEYGNGTYIDVTRTNMVSPVVGDVGDVQLSNGDRVSF